MTAASYLTLGPIEMPDKNGLEGNGNGLGTGVPNDTENPSDRRNNGRRRQSNNMTA